MITQLERAALTADFASVRSVWIFRARNEAGRISDTRQWMLENGFEMIDIQDDQLLADDGREVLRAHGKAWALRPEIHAKRLAEAMEQARQRDPALAAKNAASRPQSHPSTCQSIIDGQLCGGDLVTATVCPRCALGKSGVTATLTCDVCGHVTAIMRGDS